MACLSLPPDIASKLDDLDEKMRQIVEYEELENQFNEELEHMKLAQERGDLHDELVHAKIAAMCKHALRSKSHILAWGDKDDILQEELDILVAYLAFDVE